MIKFYFNKKHFILSASFASILLVNTLEMKASAMQLPKFGPVCTVFKDCMDEARKTRTLNIGAPLLTNGNAHVLMQVNSLELKVAGANDETMKKIAIMRNLIALDLSSTNVTDAGLDGLKGLRNLKIINLKNTKVTAAGVAKLKNNLPKIKVIQ